MGGELHTHKRWGKVGTLTKADMTSEAGLYTLR